MKRMLAVIGLLALTLGPAAPSAEAVRVRVVHRGARARVTLHAGFPLRRSLPLVYVRAPRVAFRVAPRVFLPPVVFGAVAVASLPAVEARAWRTEEVLDGEDGWTELSMDVDARGSRLLMDISGGPAQISFAEVVFENGETQVVDFNDRAQKLGTYSLLDFRDGRKVDHVRMVAKADADSATIALQLLKT